VAFERHPRLLRYPPGEPPFARTPTPMPAPPGIDAAPPNEGLEAIAALPDGRIVAFAEGLRATARMGYAWLGDGQGWTPMTWALTRPYVPVGAAVLPDGDLLVLERRFDLAGLGSRLSRVDARALRPGAPMAGTELARLEPPYISNNFEGVAVRRGPRGQSFVYLVSDDNFAPTLRTLLVMFEIVE
ncbi:MAG: esterase-like activity of phytase family protein, partial [Alphaproteobacteria bacterium]|nr:esterase-like activity of phytase family protein [Alphaproteobacteria bacterium]